MGKCKDCEFWDFQGKQDGICRGGEAPGPKIIPKSTEHIVCWPTTGKDDGCRTFTSAEVPK